MEQGNLKEKLKKGQTVIGTWNIIPSPSLVEAIGCSGLDFIVIDAEHGPVSMERAEDLIRAAEVSGMAPIIRVQGNEPHFILQALDIGAHGIQVPHVSTKKEAESVVEYSKYYPQGKRGLSPFTRAAKYGLESNDHVERSNENTVVIINVEGKEGMENLNEIVTVKDIDVIFIGPYDLSQSLNKPGRVCDPKVMDSLRKGARLTRDRGISCGSFAKDLEYMKMLIDCGMQYITYMVDSAVISDTYKNLKKSFDGLADKTRRKR